MFRNPEASIKNARELVRPLSSTVHNCCYDASATKPVTPPIMS